MTVSSLHHVSLLVADTARSLTFYRDILGLRVFADRPDLGFPGAWLEVGGQQIHLLELLDEPQEIFAGHVGRDRHVAFSVSDLDSVMASLKERGIDFKPSRSGRRAVFCRDPDGNGVELIESTKE